MNTIQKYLESNEVQGLAKSTRELYGYALGHVERFLKTTDWIDNLGTLSFDMRPFAAYLEEKNLSGKSIQQYLTITKIFLKWAGYPTDFTYKVPNKLRQENKLKHTKRWFSDADVARCLQYRFGNGDSLAYQCCVRLLVETGARVGEIAEIKPEDINLDERYVVVHGKTEARPVIFSEETADLLATLVANHENMIFEKKRLFPETGKVKAAVTQMLKDLGLKNGKDGRGAHTFRHHCATKMFYDGNMRIEDIAYLLGDKVETIRERYIHPTPEMLRKRVDQAMGWGRECDS